jgi:hypothetical protein
MNGRLIPNGDGDSIPLLKRRLVLGRSKSCDITFRFASVPTQLCGLSWERGLWRVRSDLDPPELLVNGRPTTERFLYPGDVIQIGHMPYTLDYTPQPDNPVEQGG